MKIQFGFRRAHQIAGITIPTKNMMTRNSAIFQPHVTGAIAAIAIPNPTMQARTMASFPPLMRASSFSRSALWRTCNGDLFSANGATPKGTEQQKSLAARLPRSPPGESEEARYLQKAHLRLGGRPRSLPAMFRLQLGLAFVRPDRRARFTVFLIRVSDLGCVGPF